MSCLYQLRTLLAITIIYLHTLITYTTRWCNGNVLVSLVVCRGFEPWSGRTKDYNIGIYCFSSTHVALRRKNENWLSRNQYNVSKWGDMFIRGLLFQWVNKIHIQLSVLVKYKADLIIISLKSNLFSPWYS